MKTIYHLAISRLKYNKGRSLLTIVAITLMTTLLMSIGSSALTIIRHQQLEIFLCEMYQGVEKLIFQEYLWAIPVFRILLFAQEKKVIPPKYLVR